MAGMTSVMLSLFKDWIWSGLFWADQEELLPTLGGRRVKKIGLGGENL